MSSLNSRFIEQRQTPSAPCSSFCAYWSGKSPLRMRWALWLVPTGLTSAQTQPYSYLGSASQAMEFRLEPPLGLMTPFVHLDERSRA
jgi:hypothetical protein